MAFLLDPVRRQQLIRFAEDKARNHSLSYDEIAVFRDIAAVLANTPDSSTPTESPHVE